MGASTIVVIIIIIFNSYRIRAVCHLFIIISFSIEQSSHIYREQPCLYRRWVDYMCRPLPRASVITTGNTAIRQRDK